MGRTEQKESHRSKQMQVEPIAHTYTWLYLASCGPNLKPNDDDCIHTPVVGCAAAKAKVVVD